MPLLGRDTAIKLGTLKVGLDVASISEKETKSPVSRSLQWGGKAEISQNMNGSKLFSKLDLKWGYYQLELANDSRRIATFATHDGPYCYKRLLFGMSSASEMYQHEIATVLAGIDGADSISDGPDQPTHDRRLREVLQRLHDTDKRIFNIVSLAFMGMLLTEKGIGPTGERVSAILDDREPENVTERRSFLGLANFSNRFIPHFATLPEPLRRPTKKSTPYVFGPEQKAAFQALKQRMAEAGTLAYFDKNTPIMLVADASPKFRLCVGAETRRAVETGLL